MKFTSGTIEEFSDNYVLIKLYYLEKIIYKCNIPKIKAANLFLKYKNIKYI